MSTTSTQQPTQQQPTITSTSTSTSATNNQKRSFLKTLALSFAFISFGGVGSFLNTNFFNKPELSSKSGFGSNGYGQ